MFKHRLMLSAAATALLSGAAAHADTTISDARTAGVKTSTVNGGAADNIIIATGGSITVSATGAVATVDSNNTLTNNGTLSNKNHDGAAGILIDATGKGPAGLTGGTMTNNGTVDLTGTGQSKQGIVLQGGKFTGDIVMTNISKVLIQGDVSNGVLISSNSRLIGNLNLGGEITLNQSTADAVTGSSLTGINIAGGITKDVNLSGITTVVGAGARGFLLQSTGAISGTINVTGTVATTGIATPGTKANPEGGNAFTINGGVKGGFYIAGPTSGTDTTTAGVVSMNGTGAIVSIGADIGNIKLGAVPLTVDSTNTAGYSFINRGTMLATPIDANVTAPLTGLQIGGGSFKTNVTGGILNTGSISVSALSSINGVLPDGPNAVAGIVLGANAVVPKLTNLTFHDAGGNPLAGSGSIVSAFSGIAGGTTTAIFVAAGANPGSTMEIDNLDGANISANAVTTDTTISGVTATAISDLSGTVTKIVNTGTIQAFATPLDDGSEVATAIDVKSNTTGVEILNGSATAAGSILGDISTGSGADRLVIRGTSKTLSVVTGDVSFGNATLATNDFLNMPAYGQLTGAVLSNDGNLRIAVGANSILGINNTTLATPRATLVTSLGVSGLGELDVTISDNLKTGVVRASDHITLAAGSLFNVKFGSFINNTNNFVLLDAPNGQLTIPDAADYRSQFQTPFLFTGGLCTHNVAAFAGTATDCGPGITVNRSQLILTLKQKKAKDLDLTGYANDLYAIVNKVLPNDDELGGAVVSGVNTKEDAQNVFDAFAPQVTGGSRAILISLTDQATGPVGARQRLLRSYGKQQGESTLWGVEFAQFLKDPGENLTGGGQLPGFKDHGFGFAIGADGGSASSGWYGGALTFYTGDIGEIGNRHGSTQTEWYMLSGYTDWRGRGLFLDTNLGGGVAQFKTKRIIDIDVDPNPAPTAVTLYSRTATSKHIGVYIQGSGTTGVVLNYGGTVITPQISLDGFMMRENGYNETGGGGPAGGDAFDLDVGASYTNSLRGFTGVDLRQDIDVGSFLLQPEARIGYRYDFLAKPQKVTSNFVSLPGAANSFTTIGPDPSSGNLVAGATIAASTDTWSIGVSYDFVHGTNGVNQQAGMFTLLGRI